MTASSLLLSFYGDDFTGSTDALEGLARAGLRAVLFTRSPTRKQLQSMEGLQAFGIAGCARAMTPDEMAEHLPAALTALKESGAPIVHYKICSTFDSSPEIGSIGKAIEIGTGIFATHAIPVVGGAPSLGRYCVFGNLFAACGGQGEIFRLDRHPSMRHHPATPMTEADLRQHLAHQTQLPIGLIDIRTIDGPATHITQAYQDLIRTNHRIALLDLLHTRQLATLGAFLFELAQAESPSFVVGPSAVEEALCAFWQDQGLIHRSATFAPLAPAKPMLVISGSCSPVTARQIAHATANGFSHLAIDPTKMDNTAISAAVCRIAAVLIAGHSIVVHTNPAAGRQPLDRTAQQRLGTFLGQIADEVLQRAPVQRMIIAGGDTSGRIAAALRIESLEMIAPLVRGVPLCRASAPGSPADRIEIAFKGGQIGPPDFFNRVQRGEMLV